MADPITHPTGLTRREVLQRGAWVTGAGAIAWAAPSVTTFGVRAAASTPASGRFLFSYFALVILIGGQRHGLKFERTADDLPLRGTWDKPGNLPDCTQLSGGLGSGPPPGPPPTGTFRALPAAFGVSGKTATLDQLKIEVVGADVVVELTGSAPSGAAIEQFAIKQASANASDQALGGLPVCDTDTGRNVIHAAGTGITFAGRFQRD
ncbi:MAG: hypothetical protein JJT89_00990 [Nitriliruptoraceae bacterium]|nr:hypothetical protein [Nitriliruptoraceae bacterium]